jgi:deazaflavin-dependent oxidoreductase (nitroreductase family)
VAREFKFWIGRRIANAFVEPLTRFGLVPSKVHLLTVAGRKSGEPRTNPVQLVVDGDERWVVAPYGIVDWVKNVRASGRARLARGGRSDEVELVELGTKEAAPILKRYVKQVGFVVWPYFEVDHNAPVEAWESEVGNHPVFRVVSLGS